MEDANYLAVLAHDLAEGAETEKVRDDILYKIKFLRGYIQRYIPEDELIEMNLDFGRFLEIRIGLKPKEEWGNILGFLSELEGLTEKAKTVQEYDEIASSADLFADAMLYVYIKRVLRCCGVKVL